MIILIVGCEVKRCGITREQQGAIVASYVKSLIIINNLLCFFDCTILKCNSMKRTGLYFWVIFFGWTGFVFITILLLSNDPFLIHYFSLDMVYQSVMSTVIWSVFFSIKSEIAHLKAYSTLCKPNVTTYFKMSIIYMSNKMTFMLYTPIHLTQSSDFSTLLYQCNTPTGIWPWSWG